MSGLMGNLGNILEQCQHAADGKLSDDEQDALASRVKGVFMSMHMFNNVVRAAEARDWATVEGALANYIDVQEAAGHSTSITQNATAIATASASAYANAVAGIESLPTLTDEDKDELEKLMLDVKTAKDDGMLKHAAKTLIDKAIEKGIDTLPYVLPVVIDSARSIIGI